MDLPIKHLLLRSRPYNAWKGISLIGGRVDGWIGWKYSQHSLNKAEVGAELFVKDTYKRQVKC